jgi:hypothetical protein
MTFFVWKLYSYLFFLFSIYLYILFLCDKDGAYHQPDSQTLWCETRPDLYWAAEKLRCAQKRPLLMSYPDVQKCNIHVIRVKTFQYTTSFIMAAWFIPGYKLYITDKHLSNVSKNSPAFWEWQVSLDSTSISLCSKWCYEYYYAFIVVINLHTLST